MARTPKLLPTNRKAAQDTDLTLEEIVKYSNKTNTKKLFIYLGKRRSHLINQLADANNALMLEVNCGNARNSNHSSVLAKIFFDKYFEMFREEFEKNKVEWLNEFDGRDT